MKFPYRADIAGVKYHYDPDGPRTFQGYIKADKTNPHDAKAIGIYDAKGRLIGYIPRYETELLRVWAESDVEKPLKCDIHLDISEHYNIYRGNVIIEPPIIEAYRQSIFADRRIYLTPGECGLINRQILEFFGAIRDPRLSQSTDYVILDGAQTAQIENKFSNPKYHFKILSSSEFIKEAIPLNLRNNVLYDKVVTPATIRTSVLSEFLQSFLFMEGALYRPRYSKAETDVVIQWDDSPTQVCKQAELDGKTVIKCKSLLPNIYALLEKNESNQNDCINTQNITFSFRSEGTIRTEPASKNKKGTKENSAGCMAILAIIFLAAITFYFIIK